MAEFNKTFQIKSDEIGEIRVSEEVVAIIAGLAATEIEVLALWLAILQMKSLVNLE